MADGRVGGRCGAGVTGRPRCHSLARDCLRPTPPPSRPAAHRSPTMMKPWPPALRPMSTRPFAMAADAPLVSMPADTPSEAAMTKMISHRIARRACSTDRQPVWLGGRGREQRGERPSARWLGAPPPPADLLTCFPTRPPVAIMMPAASEAPITMSSVSATNRPKAAMVTPTAMKVCRKLRGRGRPAVSAAARRRHGGDTEAGRCASASPVPPPLSSPWRVGVVHLADQGEVRGVRVPLAAGAGRRGGHTRQARSLREGCSGGGVRGAAPGTRLKPSTQPPTS